MVRITEKWDIPSMPHAVVSDVEQTHFEFDTSSKGKAVFSYLSPERTSEGWSTIVAGLGGSITLEWVD